MEESTKRGRGAPKGKRPVLWVCGAIINNELVMDGFFVKDQTPPNQQNYDSPGLFPQSIAEEAFEAKYGTKPTKAICARPGAMRTGSSKKLVIDRDKIDEYTVTTKCRSAIWGDWKGLAVMLKEDDSKALFSPTAAIDNSNKRLMTAGIVEITDLEFTDNN